MEVEYDELEEKTYMAIKLCLANEVFCEVTDQENMVIMAQVRKFAMTSSLSSKLYLKQKLFSP